MTTTITLTTHDWPVAVQTTDESRREQTSGGLKQTVYSEVVTTEEVPPRSTRQFYVTDSRSVSFAELPLPTKH